MSTPTPTPWKAGPPAWYRGQENSPGSGKRPITAGEHGVVANVFGEANADLIVRAVNSHQDLVEACVKARAVIGTNLTLQCQPNETDRECLNRSVREAIGAIESALEKAAGR